MEKNINVAEILNGKPVNTKLWSPLFGDVYTSSICSEDTIIIVNHHAKSSSFYNNGKYFNHAEAEPLLFPSKEMRDWSKFAWKKGDILVSNDSDSHIIFNGFSKNDYTTFEGKHWISVSKKRHVSCLNMQNVQDYHIEDNKEFAQTYINTIEERLGGKLNRETLEIEKQPEFKDGDIVVYGKSAAICRKFYKHTLCFYVSLNEMVGLLFDDEVESSEEYRFATEEEKKQLFSALEKEGKRWDSDKKAIVDLKPKVELKPFDKVLVRDFGSQAWQVSLFSYKDSDSYYCCNGCGWNQCIPYNEKTAHLLGTTGEWKGGEG